MPVPTLISELSTTAASNSPPGAESIGGNMDDYLRAAFAFIKELDEDKIGDAGGAINGQVTIAGNTLPQLEVERTGSTINAHIGYTTTSGTVYAGQGAALTFAVDGDTNLSTSPWFSVSATLGTFAGTVNVAAADSAAAPGYSWSGDADTGVFRTGANGVGISTAAVSRFQVGSTGEVTVLGASDTTTALTVKNQGTAAQTLEQTSAALRLVGPAMNTTSKYAPALMWGSTDSDFTTTNPKFGAAIVGVAAETFSADTDGGMDLEFHTAPVNPGAGGGMVLRWLMNDAGHFVPGADSTYNIGSAGTRPATIYADAFDGALTGNASTATTLATARNINGVAFNGSTNITVAAAAGTLTGATLASGVTASSLTSVAAGCTVGGIDIGFRNLPTLGNTATAAATGVGKCYLNTGNITVNNSVFSAGDVLCVYNNSASNITITDGTITTMRLAGTTTTGSRTLAPRGLATLFFPTASECVVSGSGVS